MEGFNVGRRMRLDAGVLSVYLSARRGRIGLIALAIRALFGRLHQAHDFIARTAHFTRIETRHKRIRVATDGEIAVLTAPPEYRIRPAALRVIVPAPAAKAG